jgi:serine/threonine-protein kinase
LPYIVARAESARRAGDIPGAAADFNRALTFCPNDLVILKRFRSLNGAVGRRQLIRRGAAILAGSLSLGCAAFGIARALKAKGARGAEGSLPVELATSVDPLPKAASSVKPDAPATSTANKRFGALPAASITARLRQLRQAPGAAIALPSAAAPVASGSNRNVKFVLTPPGAKLTVDGQPVNWFSGPVSLSPGGHHVTVFMEGSKCCKPLEQTVLVQPPPANTPDLPQLIALSLEILPASVILIGAPPNGQYSCPSINLSGFTGNTAKVKLSEPVWSGKCQFLTSPDKAAQPSTVFLRAGETNMLSWPMD